MTSDYLSQVFCAVKQMEPENYDNLTSNSMQELYKEKEAKSKIIKKT